MLDDLKIYDAFDLEMIKIALQGLTDEKIAEKTNTSPGTVKKLMKKLRENNPAIFDTIQLERALNKKIVNKDLLEYLEKAIFKGKTPLELCYELEQSEEYKNNDGTPILLTDDKIIPYLKDILLETAAFKNQAYYKELTTKLEENEELNGQKVFEAYISKGIDCAKFLSPNNFKKYYDRINKKKLAEEIVDLPLDMGISEIAKKYNLMGTAVSEILRGKDSEQLLVRHHGKERADAIIKSYEERIKQSKQKIIELNSFNTNSKQLSLHDKKQLDFIRSEQEMIIKLILQYRLSFASVRKLFAIEDKEELQKTLLYFSSTQNQPFLENAMRYVLFNYYYDMFNTKEERASAEEKQFREAAKFISEYLEAKKTNDTDKIKALYDSINDIEYRKIISRGQTSFTKLSKEEQRTVIMYRIKYLLPYREIIMFDDASMSANCPADLKKEWDLINKYNYDKFFHNKKATIKPGR